MQRPQSDELEPQAVDAWAAIIEVHHSLSPRFPKGIVQADWDEHATITEDVISLFEAAALSPRRRLCGDSVSSDISGHDGASWALAGLRCRQGIPASAPEVLEPFNFVVETPVLDASDSSTSVENRPPTPSLHVSDSSHVVEMRDLTPPTSLPEPTDGPEVDLPSTPIGHTIVPPDDFPYDFFNGLIPSSVVLHSQQMGFYSNLPWHPTRSFISPSMFHVPHSSPPNAFTYGMFDYEARMEDLRERLSEEFGGPTGLPMLLTGHSDPDGIHVFIDYSNIHICYTEELKRRIGYLPHQRIPSSRLSIDVLLMILERGRPAAKRVLAGSCGEGKDHDRGNFDRARAFGYDTLVLTRVFKSKEPRSGAESSDDAWTGPRIPPRHHEQGVDEVLQLHMSHSIMDARPGTLVLATGDGAPAEYSDGFKRMVDRALRAGWSVELVAWGQSIARVYKDREFRREWRGRFTIVRLDDYLDDLMG